jgi:hypothetical protein
MKKALLITSVVVVGFLAFYVGLRHYNKTEASPTSQASNAWNWTLFKGIGSTGTADRKGAVEFGTPSTKSFAGISGQLFDLEGLTALQFIEKYSRAGRDGDASAAYRVYQAEALCSRIEEAKQRVEVMKGSDRAQAYQDSLADTTRVCAGVTPALTDERRQFLLTAVNGGNDLARLDFFAEGPGPGVDTGEWSKQMVGFLQQSSDASNPMALILFSSVYEQGSYVQKDQEKALAYAVTYAQIRTGQPEVNPLVKILSKDLPPDQVALAYQQGKQYAQQIQQRKPS